MIYRLLFCLVILSFSCGKEVDLFQVERDKLIGEWEVESLTENYQSGVLSSTFIRSFMVTFNQEESFETVHPDLAGYTEIGTWYYQLRPEKVIVVYEQSTVGQFLIPNDYFSVIEKTDDRQIWEHETTNGANRSVKRWVLSKN